MIQHGYSHYSKCIYFLYIFTAMHLYENAFIIYCLRWYIIYRLDDLSVINTVDTLQLLQFTLFFTDSAH